MSADPPEPLSPGEDAPPDRSRRLLPVLGVLGLVSAVIAAVVIVSSGGEPTPARAPEASVRADDTSLVVGRPDAPTKVVVFEDFADKVSREFEIASRDFLEVEAAQGDVLVEYRPFPATDGHSLQAVQAWAAVLHAGTPEQAKALHELLFDRQPTTGEAPPSSAELEAWAVDAGVEQGVVSDGLERADAAFAEATREAARAADVEVVPAVIVDGRPLGRGTGVELADRLQRQILAD